MPNRRSTRTFLPLALAAGLAATSGCDRIDHPADPNPAATPGHRHETQHGGGAMAIGAEEYQVEFTFGETPGTLDAYVMDGEMEDYVRIAAAAWPAVARVEGRDFPLEFRAIANSATGETVGDTALFEARADWLAAKPALTIFLPTLTIKGHAYTNLSATLPAGAALQPARAP